MFAANSYNIHLATQADEAKLSCFVEPGSRLQHPVLIGEIDGQAAAAVSLADGRIVAGPHRGTDHLLACLRLRADARRACEATPSLQMRMLSAVSAGNHPSATGVDDGESGRRSLSEAAARRAIL